MIYADTWRLFLFTFGWEEKWSFSLIKTISNRLTVRLHAESTGEFSLTLDLFWFWFWQIIHSLTRGVSRECGVALYGAYAADVNLDSSALKDAAVGWSTTWDGSEFQSPTVRTAKEWRNAVWTVIRLTTDLVTCPWSFAYGRINTVVNNNNNNNNNSVEEPNQKKAPSLTYKAVRLTRQKHKLYRKYKDDRR